MRILQMFARGLSASLTFALPKAATTKTTEVEGAVARQAAARTFESQDPDDAEYRVIARHIAELMLADEWIEIADTIAKWESTLAQTPGGLRFHEIGIEVALSGLQSLIDGASHDKLDDLEQAEYELTCFYQTFVGSQDNHVLAVLAARAYIMMGEACRADHWPDQLRTAAYRRMARNYVDASDILDDFDSRALMSPLVAEAQYLVSRGAPAGGHQVPELFDRWILLDPANPRIYDTHAEWLADPENASEETIRTLAEEALARTEDTLGFAGYSLFFRPLLALTEDGRKFYDPELYATGIHDLGTLSASQADANRAADALAEEIETCGPNAPAAFRDTLMMLIGTEISTFYPRLWTRTEEDIRALVDEAAELFPDELEAA